MSICVVSTYPTNDLEQVFAKLTEKTKLRVLMDGNFDGVISSLYNADEYGDSSIVLECGETSAFAFMDWDNEVWFGKDSFCPIKVDDFLRSPERFVIQE